MDSVVMPHGRRRPRRGPEPEQHLLRPTALLSHLLVATTAFYLGVSVGSWSDRHCVSWRNHHPLSSPHQQQDDCSTTTSIGNHNITRTERDSNPILATPSSNREATDPIINRFPSMTASSVDRDDFLATFDIGVPVDATIPGHEQVLLLSYDDADSPSGHYSTNAMQAIAPCHTLKVILSEPRPHTCLAVVPQWDSYHVHQYMRLRSDKEGSGRPQKDSTALDASHPLRYVSRGHTNDGLYTAFASERQRQQANEQLVHYLSYLDQTLQRLRPVVEKTIASENATDHTVIVLLCNEVQLELLANFVCAALSRVLVFAMDNVTYQWCREQGGISCFDVRDAFFAVGDSAATHPQQPQRYGDASFRSSMVAKVYCVHLVNALGYDVLFQDVDVVWYQHPLHFFQRPELAEWDMIFQDDGQHTPRFAPYGANTGLYYVRNNQRTRHFFSTLVKQSDAILVGGSHQAAVNALIAEQASSRGLRVKVLGINTPHGQLFPSGLHFHHRPDYMRDLLLGKLRDPPILFHMSWTQGKDVKRQFFQQMVEWHIQDGCTTSMATTQGTVNTPCCARKPIFECHYSDKPSKLPCPGVGKMDSDKPSFWGI